MPILADWLAEDLAVYLGQHPRRNDPYAPLWPGRALPSAERFKGTPGTITYDRPWWRDGFYQRQFKPAVHAAGLPPSLRRHDLRHTAGSIMLSKGVPPYRVAQYLGHSLNVLLSSYASVLEPDIVADRDLFAAQRPTRSSPRAVVTPLRMGA